jgi:hypothetical protein
MKCYSDIRAVADLSLIISDTNRGCGGEIEQEREPARWRGGGWPVGLIRERGRWRLKREIRDGRG